MKIKILSVVFISLLVLPPVAQAQTTQPLKAVLEEIPNYSGVKRQILPIDPSETIFETKHTMFNFKEAANTKRELEAPVDHFFKNTKSHCADKLCFGMIPIPGMYFQSRKETVQFLGITTGVRALVMFRYRF